MSATANTHKQFPQELVKDNQELKDICSYFDDTRQRSKRLAQEWQSFGKYTASVLRNEVLEFETKVSILQEKLEKLSKENAELRDLCLFLNQMSGSTTSGSSIPTSTAASGPRLHSTESDHPYAVHAACVTEVNTALTGGDPPKYTGFTGDARLEDMKQHETEGIKDKNQSDPKGYVHQLEQRLERLEKEKLELIKSLSAAHILATSSTDETKDIQIPEPSALNLEDGDVIEPPPNIKAFIEYISDDKDSDQSTNVKLAQQLSSDDIVKLATLVDVSHRLSEASCNAMSQPAETVEIVILQALLKASWMQLKNKFGSKKKSKAAGKLLNIHEKGTPEKKSDINSVPQSASLLHHVKVPPAPPVPPPPPQPPAVTLSARGTVPVTLSHSSTVSPPEPHFNPSHIGTNNSNASARILRTQL